MRAVDLGAFFTMLTDTNTHDIEERKRDPTLGRPEKTVLDQPPPPPLFSAGPKQKISIHFFFLKHFLSKRFDGL